MSSGSEHSDSADVAARRVACEVAGRGDSSVIPGIIRLGVVKALKRIDDPDVPRNVYDLGLIYGLGVTPDGVVTVEMSLTNPESSQAEAIVERVARDLSRVKGVSVARVRLVWEPRWTPEALSEGLR